MKQLHRTDGLLIMGWMITELHLKGTDLIVYALLYRNSQDGNSRFGGDIDYIKAWTLSNEATILNALRSLKARNLIDGSYKAGYWAIIDGEKNEPANDWPIE